MRGTQCGRPRPIRIDSSCLRRGPVDAAGIASTTMPRAPPAGKNISTGNQDQYNKKERKHAAGRGSSRQKQAAILTHTLLAPNQDAETGLAGCHSSNESDSGIDLTRDKQIEVVGEQGIERAGADIDVRAGHTGPLSCNSSGSALIGSSGATPFFAFAWPLKSRSLVEQVSPRRIPAMRISFCSGLLLIVFASPCWAGVIEVTTSQDQFGEDTSKCSFREAIEASSTDTAFGGCPAGNSVDVILVGGFQPALSITRAGSGENNNATGDFDIRGSGSLTILGQGPRTSVINGAGLDRVFDIRTGSTVSVTFINVTIRGGDAGNENGGGILAQGGPLTIRGSLITENSAGRGGGVYHAANSAPATIRNSALTANSALQTGGGLFSNASFTMTSTTIAENIASDGGGMHAQGTNAAVVLKNITVAFNSANQRGGASLGAGDVLVDNSIFANNAVIADGARSASDLFCSSVSSRGFNLYQNRNCTFTPTLASDVAGDPLLGALVDAGAGVPVNVLLPGSPAIDTGAPGPDDGTGTHCTSTDQRGIARSGRCDRGAFEQRFTYRLTSTADAPDANIGNGICQSTIGGCTLRAAFQEASASSAPVIIEMPPGVYNVNIPGRNEDDGATGDIDIYGLDGAARVLIGHGADRSVIRGNGSDRIFGTPTSSARGTPIGMFGLRITGGDARGTESFADKGGGMLLLPRGNTTLDGVWFDGNRSEDNGGGLYFSGGGTVHITRSAFTRNTAGRDGGGADFSQSSSLAVTDSLFADNVAARYGGGAAFSIANGTELAYSTITRNHAGGRGGGILLAPGTKLGANLVVANTDAGIPASDPDCVITTTGAAVSTGYNIISQAGSGGCRLSGDLTGNLIGATAVMTRIALAGKAMPYSAPQPGNPAINRVAFCRRADGQVERFDQLRNARPGEDGTEDACTSGAIEGAADLIFIDGLDPGYPGE